MRHFHEQVQDSFQKVVLMGMTTESMIQAAVRGLVARNEAHRRRSRQLRRQGLGEDFE